MTTSLLFRAALAKRVLLATTMFSSAALLACGDSSTGTAGGPTGGSNAGGESQGGHDAGGAAAGGETAGGAAGGEAAGGAGQGGAGGEQDVERCFPNPSLDAACPAQIDAPTYFQCTDTFELVLAWLSGPSAQDALCCYQVDVSAANDPSCAGIGRPFMVDNTAQRARVRSDGTARGWQGKGTAPDVSGLSPATRSALARAWAIEASYEHASVASFAKFSLELLAFGAPAELVRRAHQAALDEVTHAELGFALASAYAGRSLVPSRLTKAADARCNADVDSFLRAVIREGCVGETLAAWVASAQHTVARDPAVRDALTTIARDEASHAELAWQTVSWAVRSFGGGARDVAIGAFAAAIEDALAARPPIESANHAHGRLSSAEQHAERERAVREVIRPAVSALFAA